MKIVVGIDMTDIQAEALKLAAPKASFEFVGAGKISAENASDADIVIGNPAVSVVKELKKLKLLQLNSAGNDGYDTAIRAIPGARLANASGAYGLALSEHMLTCLLMLMKNMPQYVLGQQEHAWVSQGSVRTMVGARILVLGLGDVGSQFAIRAKALGAYVIGVKRTPGEKPDFVDELHTTDELDACLPTADAVCMSLPNTNETRGIFSKKRIALMREGAYVLNVGRGSAIDQDALVAALNSGHLGGAALDVTDPEPLPPEHPLWTAQNCIITPHVAGGYHLNRTKDLVLQIAACNLKAFLAGEPLVSEVNLDRGY